MGDHKLAVTWDSHQNNICQGLSVLQQRGEFVDMTIAADGHHVKVHQMVMSLVSPYIKELITSAQCPHPVVFLNKISYEILQSILEYVYTGEVLITKEKLTDFLQACRELHIKGLEGDTIVASEHDDLLRLLGARQGEDIEKVRARKKEEKARRKEEQELSIIEAAKRATNTVSLHAGDKRRKVEVIEQQVLEVVDQEYEHQEDYQMDEHALDDVEESKLDDTDTAQQTNQGYTVNQVYPTQGSLIQYSLSNQGNIQLILNRYIYCMRHTRKNSERMWRCINYNPSGCNATCVTKDDMVIFRGRAHNHSFHDHQILKRLQSNNIYTAFSAIQQLSGGKGSKSTASIALHSHTS